MCDIRIIIHLDLRLNLRLFIQISEPHNDLNLKMLLYGFVSLRQTVIQK